MDQCHLPGARSAARSLRRRAGTSDLGGICDGHNDNHEALRCSTKHASASPGERLSRQLRPLGDRVVVAPTPHDEMTKSGILIPDTVKEKPQKGTIRRSARVGSWTTGSASRSM